MLIEQYTVITVCQGQTLVVGVFQWCASTHEIWRRRLCFCAYGSLWRVNTHTLKSLGSHGYLSLENGVDLGKNCHIIICGIQRHTIPL